MNTHIISIPPSIPQHLQQLKSAPFVLVSDISWAIYRDVCYCVRPSERHKELEQVTIFPAVAPGSLRGKIKKHVSLVR